MAAIRMNIARKSAQEGVMLNIVSLLERIGHSWRGLAKQKVFSRSKIDRYFEGRDVYVRQRGRHYHARPTCRWTRETAESDPATRTRFRRDSRGRPDLWTQQGLPYSPCHCAIKDMVREQEF